MRFIRLNHLTRLSRLTLWSERPSRAAVASVVRRSAILDRELRVSMFDLSSQCAHRFEGGPMVGRFRLVARVAFILAGGLGPAAIACVSPGASRSNETIGRTAQHLTPPFDASSCGADAA